MIQETASIESPRPLHENNAPLHLTDLAGALGTDFEVLKKLNPEILGYYLRAGQYRIKVPAGLGVKLPSALGHLNRQATRRLKRSATRHYSVSLSTLETRRISGISSRFSLSWVSRLKTASSPPREIPTQVMRAEKG